MDLSQLKGKRFFSIEEPRSPECIEQCGKTLPCTDNCQIDCICVCPIHPQPKLDIAMMKQLTSGDKLMVRPDGDKEKKSSAESLGDRMKEYEAQFGSLTLVRDKPWLARIDGHCFSKFTKGLRKPFDPHFSEAMQATAEDLLNQFQARTAYTQSDEITLIFVPIPIEGDDTEGNVAYREWPFSGRVMKIAGLMAGYASSRFNYHLNQLFSESQLGYSAYKEVIVYGEQQSEYKSSTLEKMRSGTAHFDARVFTVPSIADVYNNIYWRSAHDCVRNSVSAQARAHFSTKQLHGKNTEEKKQMLVEKDPNLDWEMLDPFYQYGCFIKKQQYQMECVDHKTGQPTQATRTRSVRFSRKLVGFDEAFAKLLADKYYT